jgi:predicted aspartyl protease
MGVNFVDAKVTGTRGRSRRVRLLVDSGAAYTLLPPKVWRPLGLRRKRTQHFVLVDGTEIQRAVSECHIALAGRDGHTPVVLGKPGDAAILGILTLETLGLVLDPFRRELQPMRMRLG